MPASAFVRAAGVNSLVDVAALPGRQVQSPRGLRWATEGC